MRNNKQQEKAAKMHRKSKSGFTVVELVIAIAVSAIVVVTIGSVLSRISRARDAARLRLDAVSRASAALDNVRRDLASVIRDSDLFFTRVVLYDGMTSTPYGQMDRDEVLIYNNRLRPLQRDEYAGEGGEYESQYRIQDDRDGSVLWMRRDAVPDENGEGGGTAMPSVDGVVGISIEAYDGETWYPDWDSDELGLPWALRVTVTATGDEAGSDATDPSRSLAVLRTQVPIDRIVPPPPPPEDEESAAEGEMTPEEEAAAAAAGGDGAMNGGTQLPPGGDSVIGGGGQTGGGFGQGGRPNGGNRPGSGGGVSDGGRPGGGFGGGINRPRPDNRPGTGGGQVGGAGRGVGGRGNSMSGSRGSRR
jgi:type II secretion system protein J